MVDQEGLDPGDDEPIVYPIEEPEYDEDMDVELGEEVPATRNEYERRLARLVRKDVLDEIEQRIKSADARFDEHHPDVLNIIKEMRDG